MIYLHQNLIRELILFHPTSRFLYSPGSALMSVDGSDKRGILTRLLSHLGKRIFLLKASEDQAVHPGSGVERKVRVYLQAEKQALERTGLAKNGRNVQSKGPRLIYKI